MYYRLEYWPISINREIFHCPIKKMKAGQWPEDLYEVRKKTLLLGFDGYFPYYVVYVNSISKKIAKRLGLYLIVQFLRKEKIK